MGRTSQSSWSATVSIIKVCLWICSGKYENISYCGRFREKLALLFKVNLKRLGAVPMHFIMRSDLDTIDSFGNDNPGE